MNVKGDVQVLLGAIVGAVLGHYAFMWLITQGFYAMVLPGGLVGLGAGLPKHGKIYLAAICGLIALAAGLLSEWRAFPFAADESLSYFLAHCHKLRPMSWLMILAGTAIGFWIPFRRGQDMGDNVGTSH